MKPAMSDNREVPVLTLLAWGTYDIGKPRNRILLQGLRERGVDVLERHAAVWEHVADKTQIHGARRKLSLILRWLAAYPRLIVEYLRAPPHDAVYVGYMGHLDVLVLWPWARIRGRPIIWDVFLSLYSTVVEDRQLLRPEHPLALLLRGWEWVACRAADHLIMDTEAHGQLLVERYGIPRERLTTIYVGVEPDLFPIRQSPPTARVERAEDTGVTAQVQQRVVFYGQLIPLHGVEVILAAAEQSGSEAGTWRIIGRGQQEQLVRDHVTRRLGGPVVWVEWVPYQDLQREIGQADVCLGIFGTSDKASRVIPNKVFQILSTGKPLITRDSPAVRELLGEDPGRFGVTLIPAGDPEALAEAVRRHRYKEPYPADWFSARRKLVEQISPLAVARPLDDLLRDLSGIGPERVIPGDS
jgi:glycosyltransferase involved in cell wall biosynthesis